MNDMRSGISRHRAGALAAAVVLVVASARSLSAQASPSADTTAARQQHPAAVRRPSVGRRLIGFLAPEVGYAIGRGVGGTNGAIAGISLGMVVGGAVMLLDPALHDRTTAGEQLCLVAGDPGTPAHTIPGTPPTPAVGDIPGTPGTPDVIVPGTPPTPAHWERCR